MPSKSSSKKGQATKASASKGIAALASIVDLQRAGMPSVDSIVGVRALTPPAAAVGAKKTSAAAGPAVSFRVIRTTEVDGYDQAPAVGAVAAAAKKAAKKGAKKAAKKGGGDNFTGTARRAAKLSLSAAPTRNYSDLRSLINTLPTDAVMASRQPRITTNANQGRVQEEERNVRVKTFLYAASRENDNDFHLILGRNPNLTPERYMTMELSGLPPQNAPAFARLKAARDAYKAFFAGNLPGTSYDFYDPPIPVEIEGSLFWDSSHATGSRPGPQSLRSRIPTVWEVHPISKITFNP